MAMKSLCPEAALPDPAADRKESRRVEQYRVSGAAIYFKTFPGEKYLPFCAVERAWGQKSSVRLTGCCGKDLPVVVLRVKYSGGFYKNFTFEKQESADRVLAALREARPEVPQEPEGWTAGIARPDLEK